MDQVALYHHQIFVGQLVKLHQMFVGQLMMVIDVCITGVSDVKPKYQFESVSRR